MKRRHLLMAFVFLAASLSVASALEPQADAHDLTVNITEGKGKTGEIHLALFSKDKGFPMEFSKADKTAKIKLDKPTHVFAALPAGKYVVVVFHDKNGNGKLDKTLIGFPTEPVGLSNGLQINKGKPDFDKAKVTVTKATTIDIKLVEFGQ
jgi:uncharacterized protein (DUF2141 family)